MDLNSFADEIICSVCARSFSSLITEQETIEDYEKIIKEIKQYQEEWFCSKECLEA